MLAMEIQRFTFPQLHASSGGQTSAQADAEAALSPEAIAAEAAAHAELERLRAAAVAAGHAAGHDAGMAAGYAAAMEQVAAECRTRSLAVARIEASMARVSGTIDAAVSAAVVQIAAQLATSIVDVELRTNRAVIRSLAEVALTQLREAVGPVTLVLNPEDRALLALPWTGAAAVSAAASALTSARNPDVAVVADAAFAPMADLPPMREDALLARGDLRLETGEGSVEVSLRARVGAALAGLADLADCADPSQGAAEPVR